MQKPFLKEIKKIQLTPVVLVTTYTEHTSYRNVEATLEEIMKLQVTPVVIITTYTEHTRSRNMKTTFRGNHNTIYSQPKLKCLLFILNILVPEIWKPLLEEVIILQFSKVEMVITYTEHTRSRNMEATFRGNHETIGNLNGYYIY